MKKDDCIFCKLANGEFPTNSIYEDENFFINDEFKASFELKKEDLKDYVYVDNNALNFSCESGYEDYYLNRTYKFINMEKDCAIFFRNY